MKGIRIIAAALICLMLWAALPVYTAAVSEQYGMVNVDSVLNVRSGPGTSYDAIGALSNDAAVYIIESVVSDSGDTWYKIRFDGVEYGFVHSDYVNLVQPDLDFEAQLDAEGFPESYKLHLRALHELYPNWVFTAQELPMDFATALAAQCKPKHNLVSADYGDAWKSVDPAVYDRENGVWYGLDGAAWVGASEAAIAYYLDPRNFINKSNIFLYLTQSYDLANHTREGLEQIVADTFLSEPFPEDATRTYVDVLMTAADQSGVSPYILSSMIIVEQGRQGTGNSISGTVAGFEGLYNYLNIGAYASGGFDAVERGLWWAAGAGNGSTDYGRPWDSREKSILGSAEYYGSNYVTVGQDTLYLKKFDLIDGGNGFYDHQYMTNIQGAVTEASILKNAYVDVMDAPLVFSIPIFDGLPDEPCPRPYGSGTVEPRLLDMDIAELPETGELTLDDADRVADLLARYEALEDTQKEIVTRKADLDAADAQIKLLQGQPIEPPVTPPEILAGDADGDGKVSVADILKLKALILSEEQDETMLAICDLDGDGALTVGDIISMKGIIMTEIGV